MKKLSLFNKIMFSLNIVLTILTFVAYLLPFLAPKLFPFLSVFTLIMPLMLIFNFLFFLYWLLQTKRQMLLSGIVLLLGITFITKFYKFSGTILEHEPKDFVLMSYNVRKFNVFKWIPKENIAKLIGEFIQEKNPDILCIQEYQKQGNEFFRNYKYRFIFRKKNKTIQAIFTNYKIIDTGYIDFPNTANNVIFADIIKGQDTLRIYSMHLQSIKISKDIDDELNQQTSKLIFNRMSEAFKKQQFQAEMVEMHKSKCPYPMIICGDLNNSAYSYVYRHIRGDMKDAFEEAGKGFGKSYNYEYYPARIDYIFTDKSIVVKEFKTIHEFVNSDHFPIITRLAFAEEEE